MLCFCTAAYVYCHLTRQSYNTYVRPSIEYALSVWAPYTDCLTNQLKMVQRRAARFVQHDYSRHSSVTDILADLKWDTLQHRRNVPRVSMFYTRLKTTYSRYSFNSSTQTN